MGKGRFVIAFAVFDFAIEHLCRHGQHRSRTVVEVIACVRDTETSRHKQGPFLLGGCDITERGMGNSFGIVQHRRGMAVEFLVGGQRLIEDRLPLAKAN